MRSSEITILLARRKRVSVMVEQAMRSLPPAVQETLINIAIVVEDEPPDDMEQLGLYEGVPQADREGGEPILPDRITLFRGPLERAFPDDADRRDEIRITLLHEIGHHIGLDEGDLDRIGLG